MDRDRPSTLIPARHRDCRKSTRIGQLLNDLSLLLLGLPKNQRFWKGMEMFLEHQARAQDQRMRSVYGHFQGNLQNLLEVSRQAGIKNVVSTVASNLKDCAPFASLHDLGTSSDKSQEWSQI
jgi:hypothetical protein